MTWNEQAESMTKIWTEAQKALWQGWYDAVQSASMPAVFNPSVVDEWRKLASQGMNMWTGGSDQLFKTVSGQLLASQAAMMQLLQQTTTAWQSMAPKLDAGENWQAVLNSYVEQLRKQMMPNNALTQGSQDTAELWRMYLEQVQKSTQPWMGVAQQAPGLLGGAMMGNSAAPVIELSRLFWSAYDSTASSLDMSPGFGFTRELEEKVARGFVAWKKMMRSSNDYQALMANAWAGVYEQVLQELKTRAEQDKPIDSVRGLMRLWVDAADRSFDKVLRSEEYATIQGEFVTDTMNYRLHEQGIVEEALKYAYVPTRSEMDEAHRNIYELRKEVKALKKALAQAQPTAVQS